MSTQLATIQPQQAVSIHETRMSAASLIEQRKAIVEVLEKTMTKDVDFGIIPGTPKPTLFKPGSEKILALFHLGIRPIIEDLSTPDVLRYRVHAQIFHQPSQLVLGEGIGEASSGEDKYQWRAVVCNEEWESTPQDQKREKWKKGYDNRPAYSVRQVHTNMEDTGNTILKMAKKRAQIDAVLTATAASDIFSQDLEDLQGVLDSPESFTPHQAEQMQQSQTQPQQTTSQPAVQGELLRKEPVRTQMNGAPIPQGERITEEQGKKFWAVSMKNHGDDYKVVMKYLREVHKIDRKADLLASRFPEAMLWAEKKGAQTN